MTVDELLATAETGVAATDEMLVIDPDTRQINLPGVELVFGVESDAQAERKYFYCPRYVGNGLDLASCFIRVNYRNANGAVDAYLVDDVTATEDAITFSWALHRKVTLYKGQVQFVVCCNRPGGNGVPASEWNTTVTTGIVLAGLEPDSDAVEAATADAITALLAKVDAQSANVEAVGAQEVAEVTAEGATQVQAVKTASETAEAAAVAEIEAKGVNTLATIPDDYTALSGAVTAIERSMAPGIVCEVEGTAVAVSDASNQAMRGLRIFGKSTQDGTPTPDALVEIVSVENPVVTVCGSNLLDYEKWKNTPIMNGTGVYEENGITITATGDSYTNHTSEYCKVPCVAGVKYILSWEHSGATGLIYIFPNGKNADKVGVNTTQATKIEYTPPSGVEYFNFRFGVPVADTSATFKNIRINVLETRDFESYKAAQTVSLTHTLPGIPVTSGGNYTDSDGQQWICDEVNLERGVYVQRVKNRVFTGNETWEKGSSVLNGMHRYYTWEYDMRPDNSGFGLCTHFPRTPFAAEQVTSECVRFGQNNIAVFFFTPSITTTDEWVEYVTTCHNEGTPITIQYVLTTPIETALSETEIAAYRALHTNKPNTTILNDSGAHMAVAYTADTKLYIDNLLKE